MPFEGRKTKLENQLSLRLFFARAAVSANQSVHDMKTLLHFKVTTKR